MATNTPGDASDYLEARARGREAFWHGRPIWTNPFTGERARDWTAGWKQALVELSIRRGGRVLTASTTESAAWQTLLALYRPPDVAAAPRQRKARPKKSRAA